MNSAYFGWTNTDFGVYQGPDAIWQFVGRVGNLRYLTDMVLYLRSNEVGSIAGENIRIDGGLT